MERKFNWNLTKETLNILENEESHDPYEAEAVPKFVYLCNKIKKNEVNVNFKCKEQIFSGFNDYLHDTVTSESEDSLISKKSTESYVPENNTVLSSHLATAIKNQETSVQEIIDLVSNVHDNNLETNLVITWQQLKKSPDKLKFFQLLSGHPTCSKIICNKILLKELKETKENFNLIMEFIKPHLKLFESSAISKLLIQLIVDEDSFVFEEISWINEMLPSLSASQKLDLLSYFIDIMEKEADKNHLQLLSVLLEEVPLNEHSIARLVQFFNRNLNNFINDRFLGKILLTILDCSPQGVTTNVIKELSQICNRFKGVMRFRINASLKKFIQ